MRDMGVTDFRAYFESQPRAVARCAAMVKVLDVNRSALDMYRAESKEKLLNNFANILSRESRNVFTETLVTVAENRMRCEAEGMTRTLKGEEKHISLRWSVAMGHEKTLSKVFVAITDITDLKRAEKEMRNHWDRSEKLAERLSGEIARLNRQLQREITGHRRTETALRESEEKLRGFMDSATDAFFAWDSELNLVDINDVGRALFTPGMRKADVVGKNMMDIVPGLGESGRYDNYLQIVKEGKPHHVDDIIAHPRLDDVQLAVTAFKAGDVIGMTVTDTTKRKRREDQRGGT